MLDTKILYKYKDASKIKNEKAINEDGSNGGTLATDHWYFEKKVKDGFHITISSYKNLYKIINGDKIVTWVHENWVIPIDTQLELEFQ